METPGQCSLCGKAHIAGSAQPGTDPRAQPGDPGLATEGPCLCVLCPHFQIRAMPLPDNRRNPDVPFHSLPTAGPPGEGARESWPMTCQMERPGAMGWAQREPIWALSCELLTPSKLSPHGFIHSSTRHFLKVTVQFLRGNSQTSGDEWPGNDRATRCCESPREATNLLKATREGSLQEETLNRRQPAYG